jgi:hypothetical protein
MLDEWNRLGNYPPDYGLVDGAYCSVADMFQMVATALGERRRPGALPESVTLQHVYGPLAPTMEDGYSQGAVTVGAMDQAAAAIARTLSDSSWKPLPENIIPSWVNVDGVQLNGAQFLRLMLAAYAAPSSETKIPLRTSHMFSDIATTAPHSRPMTDDGAIWTFKPAPLNLAILSASEHASADSFSSQKTK